VEFVASKRTRHAANVLGFVLAALASASMVNAQSLTGTVTVDISGAPIASFVPDQAFGAALDGHEEGETSSIYSANNIQKMRSAGLQEVSYRLRSASMVNAQPLTGTEYERRPLGHPKWAVAKIIHRPAFFITREVTR
jgi:hypothetical protein